MKKPLYFYSNIFVLALVLLLMGNFVFGWTIYDSNIFYNTGNVGIGTTGPKNKLDVEGSAVIGTTYSGTNTAPPNGLLVEGNVGIGKIAPSEKLEVLGAIKIGTAIGTENGTIRWTGSDFEGRKSDSWVSLTATSTRGGFATSTEPGESNVYYNTNYYIDGVSKTGTLQRACYSTGAKELGTTGNFCGDSQGTAVAGDICNSTKAWVDGSLITGDRTACSAGCASTDPGISTVYYDTNYYIDGIAKTGTLQRACYSTGAKELGTTGNFCGDDQGTAVAGDICNSTKAWVDGSFIIGSRTACSESGGGSPQKLPATGQTTSYATTTQVCGDGGTGTCDDAYYKKGAVLSYTNNGDGTITDNNTGLMWKRCSEPSTAISSCPSPGSYTWQDAINQCEGLDYAGYTDWRMPNVKESFSIIKSDLELGVGTGPFIDLTAFPGTLKTADYWTSTSWPAIADQVMVMYMDKGSFSYTTRTCTFTSVRCVRGG